MRNFFTASCAVVLATTICIGADDARAQESDSGTAAEGSQASKKNEGGTDGSERQPEPTNKGDIRVTKTPVLIESVEAEYTQEAIDKRIEGTVGLQLELDANGDVTNVKVIKSVGYGLDEAAVEAAKQFKFEPAEINNVPSAVTFTFQIEFTLPILPSVFEGFVVDATTGDPVSAMITITYERGDFEFEEAPTATTPTDEAGGFLFGNVPPGTYSVRIEVDAYQDFMTEIELVSGKTSSATYEVVANVDNMTGQVIEAGTRTPLPGIKVEVIGTDEDAGTAGDVLAETFTGTDGGFAFAGIAPGDYTLRASSDAYDPQTATALVKKGEILNIELYIQRSVQDEYTVTTTTRRAETVVNRRQLSLKEIRKIPGTSGDVVRSVQNMPGVARAPFVSGAIIVRGAAPANTGIYVDGARIPNVFHFLLGPAVINSEMIASLDFFPGNFSPYYGHALGGIIELKTRSPKTDRIHGQLEIDLLDTTVMVEGPIIDGLSFAASARRSYIDTILPLVIPDDAPIASFVAPVYYDYQGWLTYTGIEGHRLALKVFGSDDRIEVLLADKKAPGNAQVQIDGLDFNTGFIATQLEWNWRPDIPLENDLSLTFSYRYNRFSAAADFNYDISGYYLELRDDIHYRFMDELLLRTGFEGRQNFSGLKFETPRFEDDTQTDNGAGSGRPAFDRAGLDVTSDSILIDAAVYAELEITPISGLLVAPGVRVDYFDGIKKVSAQPRLSARYDILDELTVKGGVGLFTQEPNRIIRSGVLVEPDEFTYQKAMQYSAGIEYSPFEFLTFDLTGFYRNIWDLVTNTNAVKEDENGKSRSAVFSNEGLGRAYGAEVLIRHRPANRFFGWLAYTLSWSEQYRPNTKTYAPFQYDQRHILTLVAGYNLPWNIDVGLRFRLVSGSPFTPIVGAVYNSDQDKYEPVYGEPNSERYPIFHQLDLRIDKKFVFKKWILGVFLDIQNLYYAKNREGTIYNYDFSDSQEITGLPIFPNFGVTAQF